MAGRISLLALVGMSFVLLGAAEAEGTDNLHWSCKSAAHSTGPMRFEFFNGSRIFLQGQINGTAVNILLDSGFSGAAVDSELAQKLGLKKSGSVTAQSGGGQVAANVATGAEIRIGCLAVREPQVGLLDLQSISKQMGHPIDVIIGQDVMRYLVVDIDFAAQQIAFTSPQAFVTLKAASEVALGENGVLKTVSVSIEGGPAVPFDLDLGNALALIVFNSHPDRSTMLAQRPSSTTLLVGMGGQAQAPIATLKSVTFGSITFSQVPVVFAPTGSGAFDSKSVYGNVGMPILSRFRIITDFGHDKMWLIPSQDAATRAFEKDRSGLRAIRAGDRLTVYFVAPGSPAEHDGWKAGDQIVAVNGTKIDALGATAHWQGMPSGTIIRLTLTTGEQRDLKLADYY